MKCTGFVVRGVSAVGCCWLFCLRCFCCWMLLVLLSKPKRKRVLGNDFEASSSSSGQRSYRAAMIRTASRRRGMVRGSLDQFVVSGVARESLESSDYIDLGQCMEVCAVEAEVYTIEFQKRGLPHCHTLLWVSAEYAIKEPSDVDRYISAELPNEQENPISIVHLQFGLLNRTSIMEDGDVASLVPYGKTPPLKVRAIRKWNPAFRATQTCFLFVDKEGTAIQANAKDSEQRIVENRVRLGSCYQLRKYACEKLDNYSNTLTHCTNLVIGGASQFTPIPDTGEIPREHFDIATRERMEAACDKDVLIDYIGILDDTNDKLTIDGKPFVVLKILDCSNQYIHATLWEEIAISLERYARPVIDCAKHPKIIALTALKVKVIGGRIRLQSTTATYVYLHPTLPETHKLLELYENPTTSVLAKRQSTQYLTTGKETITTIDEILRKSSAELMICSFERKEWSYIACPLCTKRVTNTDPDWFCPKDDIIENPVFSYRISAIITDGTGNLAGTIFDDAVTQLVGIPCSTIISSNPAIALNEIPEFLTNTVGKQLRFTLQATKNDKNGRTRCTVNRIAPFPLQLSLKPDTANQPGSSTTSQLQNIKDLLKTPEQDVQALATKTMATNSKSHLQMEPVTTQLGLTAETHQESPKRAGTETSPKQAVTETKQPIKRQLQFKSDNNMALFTIWPSFVPNYEWPVHFVHSLTAIINSVLNLDPVFVL
ncbi:hypothetical protein QVD17_02323 [Tagetes erecta]|uniref:Replication factor A C-terminal domain-containing protein n=1 Tax=Tagetes erecta TaxID=13708 RepID=A0AAD8LDR4_TARER|nr:hypothetical protein QVD17_02323 [Tagetes erecta]